MLLALFEDPARFLDAPDQIVDHQQIAARVGAFPEVLSVGQREGVGAAFAGGQHDVLVDHDDSAARAFGFPAQSAVLLIVAEQVRAAQEDDGPAVGGQASAD